MIYLLLLFSIYNFQILSIMNTLHIIGNGFDIYHGIDSRYWDFYQFLEQNRYSSFISQMENFFTDTTPDGDILLWSDFEMALGNIDFNSTFDYCTEDYEIDYDHMMRSTAQIEDAPGFFLGGILQEMHEKFEEWVKSINIIVYRKTLEHFDSKGRFFTFNYTDTLETVYKIPSENILHIHGSRTKNEPLIVGHCNYIDPHSIGDEDMLMHEENALRSIAELANQEMKSVEEIIAHHNSYWKSLSEVDEVNVYGHSLSNVDLPYFRKIKENIKPCAQWNFSFHDDKDVKNIKQMIATLGLSINSCTSFRM